MSSDVSTVLESGEYVFDPATPWTPADAEWLETVLATAAHFDGEAGHDPVACQIDNVRTRDRRGGHQERVEWRRLREEAWLTQDELAAQVGSTKENISRYEKNRRRPENEYAYFEFLRAQAELLAAEVRLDVFHLQSKRDGWWQHGGDPWTLEGRDARWEVLYKPGGLFDRWRDTGTLPAWTPADAGVGA